MALSWDLWNYQKLLIYQNFIIYTFHSNQGIINTNTTFVFDSICQIYAIYSIPNMEYTVTM